MARKFLRVLVLISLLNVGAVYTGYSDDLTHRIGLGLGNPYVSLKYGISRKWSAELRGAFGSGITVIGGRSYYNWNPERRTVIYCGVEMDYVTFDTEGISGSGYVGYAFVGGEHFITKRLTFTLDIGPAFIVLKENKFKLNVQGIEYVFNLGINFYFK